MTPSSLSFGDVNVGASSSKTFSIKNTGTANLVVSKIEIGTGSGQYSVSPSSMTVTPGNSKTVTVTFKPTSAGSKSGAVAITANDIPSTKSVILSGTGVQAGSPVLSLSPSSTLSFGSVNVGSRKDMVVTVKNTGNADLVVYSATLASRVGFLVGSSEWQNKTLAPGESDTINVGFRPSETGSKSDVLTVESNAGTKKINCTGTGK